MSDTLLRKLKEKARVDELILVCGADRQGSDIFLRELIEKNKMSCIRGS
jgi:hypothetical protein